MARLVRVSTIAGVNRTLPKSERSSFCRICFWLWLSPCCHVLDMGFPSLALDGARGSASDEGRRCHLGARVCPRGDCLCRICLAHRQSASQTRLFAPSAKAVFFISAHCSNCLALLALGRVTFPLFSQHSHRSASLLAELEYGVHTIGKNRWTRS